MREAAIFDYRGMQMNIKTQHNGYRALARAVLKIASRDAENGRKDAQDFLCSKEPRVANWRSLFTSLAYGM